MIHKRIKEVRLEQNLTQPAFAEKLGVTKDVISNIEYDRVKPKQLFINQLCSVFNINEEWLKTGKGEMYLLTSEDELLAEAFSKITISDNEKIRKIVTNLCYLDERYIDIMCDLISNLAEDNKNE